MLIFKLNHVSKTDSWWYLSDTRQTKKEETNANTHCEPRTVGTQGRELVDEGGADALDGRKLKEDIQILIS